MLPGQPEAQVPEQATPLKRSRPRRRVASMAEEGDVTWTVRTASNSLGADRSSYGYAINPGGTVTDAMVVANRGSTALTLTVYAADGFTEGRIGDVGSGSRTAAANSATAPPK